MRYKNSDFFEHSQTDRIGVIITNLGTPNAPTASALRPYLRQFLSDTRVVEASRFIWWPILNFIILPLRPKRSAKAYKEVWTDEGSPLAVHTKAQYAALQLELKKHYGDNVIVDWAMRYGQPSISQAIDKMMAAGVRKLLVLPLYPQYSATTTASTFDAVAEDFTKRRWLPELRFVTSYCDNANYIQALADSIKNHWQEHDKPQKLVFSFHGVPLEYLHKGDPYHCECLKTARLVAECLNIGVDDYTVSFQSRFGPKTWLQPYTSEVLKALPENGVKSVQVICPGFSADCLETIEEIDIENRGYFMEAGGETFSYIPALNSSQTHINMLSALVKHHTAGWLPIDSSSTDSDLTDNNKRDQLFQQCPHNRK